MLLLAVTAAAGYTPTLVAMIFGLVVGVFGHIIRSRTLIITGILIIGVASAYFSFVLSKVT